MIHRKRAKHPKVAMLVHPLSYQQFVEQDIKAYYPLVVPLLPFIRKLSKTRVQNFFSQVKPHKLFNVSNFLPGLQADLLGVAFPLFPMQILMGERAEVLEKIVYSCQLAKKLGADMVVLGGYTSVVSDGGELVMKEVNVPVTTGNTLTAALCLEGVDVMLRIKRKQYDELVVTIVGATGDIGSICARVIAGRAKRIVLCGRDVDKLRDFADELSNDNAEVSYSIDPNDAIKDSDLVITATSTPSYILESNNFKKESIVCDVSIPSNLSSNIVLERSDVTVFRGGNAKLCNDLEPRAGRWSSFLPEGAIYGCLCEGLLLALEGRRECFSIGRGNIKQSSIEEMIRLLHKYRLEVANINYT